MPYNMDDIRVQDLVLGSTPAIIARITVWCLVLLQELDGRCTKFDHSGLADG